MEIIRPAPVNDATLIASNISDTVDYPLWLVGTTYAVDQIVVGPDHHEYQSLQNANTGHSLDDPVWWLDRGMNRKWRMFDQTNSSQSTAPEEIDVTVSVLGRADSVSLLNILAATVQIISTTVADGEVYNETFNLISDSGVNNWYDYFFEPIIRRGDLVVTDLPIYGDPTIQVILTEPGGDAQVGALVIGQSFYIGATVYGARFGIQDYSRKVVNEFGDWSIVQRAFSKRGTFKVVVSNSRVDAISAFLSTIRATPVVYKGTIDFASSWIFGYFRDWQIEISHVNESYCTLEIEGLT